MHIQESNSVQLNKDQELHLIVIDRKDNSITSNRITEHQTKIDPFASIPKNSDPLNNQQIFNDDMFKLPQLKGTGSKKIVKKRLCDIFPVGSSLLQQSQSPSNGLPCSKPTYICQMPLLPPSHYISLIQPSKINSKGYYSVIVYRDGRLTRQIVDDWMHFDQNRKKVVGHTNWIQDSPWRLIIIKVWAKIRGGYNMIDECAPFQFLKCFSYPDWMILNPSLQPLPLLILQLHRLSNPNLFFIAQTKSDPNVGLYGFLPSCAAYRMTGYYQQYGDIYIRIKNCVQGKWNGKYCDQEGGRMSGLDIPKLQQDECLMPLNQFLNIFHLGYCTFHKYKATAPPVSYIKYTLNLDARQSKAKILCIQVLPNSTNPTQLHHLALVLHFAPLKPFDILAERSGDQSQAKTFIPHCKILIGYQLESTNNQSSYIESVKEKMLKNEEGHFLPIKSSALYQYVASEWFQGSTEDAVFHLEDLKPGRYYLRLKVEKLRVEYRVLVNAVSTTEIKITQPKMEKSDHKDFLNQTLSNKGRTEERNITYIDPTKKESWMISNPDFPQMGYGYLLFQVGLNSGYTLHVLLDPKKIKESGYRLKHKQQRFQGGYTIVVGDGESLITVFKEDDEWQGKRERLWPPDGIEVTRVLNTVKLTL